MELCVTLTEMLIRDLDMNIRRIAALFLGLIVIVFGNTLAIGCNDLAIAAPQPEMAFTPHQREITRQLQQANIIYLGEIHDRTSDRQQQIAIIRSLLARQPRVAVGMEMFQRPAQPLLDRYLAGKITEAELRQQTEFDLRWGYSWDDYVSLLRFAKTNRLPLIALNTPTEITRKVAKQGLESLSGEDLRYIPPIAEIDRTNTKYQNIILASYQQHAQNASINSKSFDRFYTAQLLWDETMAERIATFIKDRPDYQIVVLAGQAHIVHNHGIPDRVQRRLGAKFTQKTVLLQPDGGEKSTDFVWSIENDK
jgi:uncharacterized iron-regulated protein